MQLTVIDGTPRYPIQKNVPMPAGKYITFEQKPAVVRRVGSLLDGDRIVKVRIKRKRIEYTVWHKGSPNLQD